MLTDSGYRSVEPGQETIPSCYGPAQFSSAEPSHPLADGLIFANWLGTPSVQNHCLATFNPCMLIGVWVTNGSPDTASGCPDVQSVCSHLHPQILLCPILSVPFTG